MNQRLERLFENEAFNGLDEKKRDALRNFAQNSSGKSANEMLAEIMKLNGILNGGNPLTDEEKNIMTDVLLNMMSSDERKKLISVLSLLR